MKYLSFYQKVLNCQNPDQVFNYFTANLKPSNMLWSYFVNWDKVFKNTKEIELSLNILNYLLDKKDFDREFKSLLKKHPEIAKVIPALAVRLGGNRKKFKILVKYQQKQLIYEDYDFTKDKPTDEDIDKYLTFIKETGLKKLITTKKIKNLVDYMIGLEAGLDSNGRKNRGGRAMEDIVEVFVKDVCKKGSFEYIREANAEKIKAKFGYKVPVDKTSRRYDFVVDCRKTLSIIESNFYGGGGSKLKATAGEYRGLFDILRSDYPFIWITDGLGWENTTRPLREAFDHNDYVLSLAMLEKGVLEVLLK